MSFVEATAFENRECERSSVAVVGLGYVGLPTTLAFAAAGRQVIGYDVSESRLAAIKAQRVDVLDADRARLRDVLDTDQLALTTEASAIRQAGTVIVCVPTPVDEHLVPDLSALSQACSTVVEYARKGQTIVLTSTTYVGCTRDFLVHPLQQRGLVVGTDVFVAFSPERIDPGNPAHLPEHTPRVVGGVTEECTRRAMVVLTDSALAVHAVSSPEAAELTKLLENTFRAVNIAFANEFSDVAREFGVDIMEVITAASTKPYGFMPFYPGPGVGGHCIPCDPHYLLWQLKARHVQTPLTEAAMAAIATRPHAVVARIQQLLADAGKPLTGATILVVGVAYKPGIADLRSSPSLEIIDELQSAGADVRYVDPHVEQLTTHVGTLNGEVNPAAGHWDLALIHTVHPGLDYRWLDGISTVLDATYRLPAALNRHVL
jgi:UDP-N-acetyl-D-glucosamine dehydrogenase